MGRPAFTEFSPDSPFGYNINYSTGACFEKCCSFIGIIRWNRLSNKTNLFFFIHQKSPLS